MRRFGGQAARHLLGAVVALLALSALALVALAWALSTHPIAAPWLAQRLRQEADAAFGPGALKIGAAAIAWDGFRQGSDDPLAIRLTGVTARLPGVREAKAAEIDIRLDLWPLLHGILRPRSAMIEHARVVVERPDATAIPAGRPAVSVRTLLNATPLANEQPWMKSIRFLGIAGSDIVLGATGVPILSALNASVVRDADGEIDLDADFAARSRNLAALAPTLADASRLDAPVSVHAQAVLDADGRPLSASTILRAGPGRLALAADPVAVRDGMFSAAWSRSGGLASILDLSLQPGVRSPVTHLRAEAVARLEQGARIVAQGTVRLDQVRLDDLDRLWPEGIARDARKWFIANVTAGTGGGLDAAFALTFAEDGGDAAIQRLSGTMTGRDLTVHWLRPVPPVEHATATMQILSPDRISFDFGGGEERAGKLPDTLQVQSGSVVISGLSAANQVADIRVRVGGSVPAALALLANPRLHLLADHPMKLKNPRGEAVADVHVVLPVDVRVTMDQVQISADARLANLAIGDVVGGHGLRNATAELAANADGLSFSGIGAVAGIPGQFSGVLDFRAGPPGQVLQRIEARGATTVGALAALGVDTGGLLAGEVRFGAVYEQERDGDASVALRGGLDDAEIRVNPLGWRKPPGVPASLSGRLVLDSAGRIQRIDTIEGSGTGFALQGSARLFPGGAADIALSRVVLGATEAHGTIALAPDGGTTVSVAGPTLDLGSRLREIDGGAPARGRRADTSPWSVNARFSRAIVAHRREVGDFVLDARGEGGRVQSLRLSAETAAGEPVEASITPERGGRVLRVSAKDGGALLRDLGALGNVEGGALTIAARYDDRRPEPPLSGVAELDGFRLRSAPTLGKVLQAASLYGLVQAMQGPGMNFTRLVAPFTLADGVLSVSHARAFNPSLGLTARGSIDIDRNRLDFKGTIVPAYYLNSFLGRLPVVGRLFSPEKGGGLIAADFSASGPFDDPAVTVNPLSALTPGFLRSLFGGQAQAK